MIEDRLGVVDIFNYQTCNILFKTKLLLKVGNKLLFYMAKTRFSYIYHVNLVSVVERSPSVWLHVGLPGQYGIVPSRLAKLRVNKHYFIENIICKLYVFIDLNAFDYLYANHIQHIGAGIVPPIERILACLHWYVWSNGHLAGSWTRTFSKTIFFIGLLWLPKITPGDRTGFSICMFRSVMLLNVTQLWVGHRFVIG